MKKKTFGRRTIRSGPTHSESPAPQIDPAARQALIDELAEQARNGGARDQAELERQMVQWRAAHWQQHLADYGTDGC